MENISNDGFNLNAHRPSDKDEIQLTRVFSNAPARKALGTSQWGDAEFASHLKYQKAIAPPPPARRLTGPKKIGPETIVSAKVRWSKDALALYPRLPTGGVLVGDWITKHHLDDGRHAWTRSGKLSDQGQSAELMRSRVETSALKSALNSSGAWKTESEHSYRFVRVGGSVPLHYTREELAIRYGKPASKIDVWIKYLGFPTPDPTILDRIGSEFWTGWQLRTWERRYAKRYVAATTDVALASRPDAKRYSGYACDHFPLVSLPRRKCPRAEIAVATVKRAELLSSERERQLITQWQVQKDAASRDALMRAFAGYIKSLARQYLHYGQHLQNDFESAASIGFMLAADKFDIESPHRFSTYAWYWARSEMQACALGSHGKQSLDRLASRKNNKIEKQQRPRSLGLTLGDDGTTLGDLCFVGMFQSVDDFQTFGMENLNDALKLLNVRERRIFESRYMDAEKNTLEGLGNELGISAERVRQIEAVAIKKLKNVLGRQPDDDSELLRPSSITREAFSGPGQAQSRSALRRSGRNASLTQTTKKKHANHFFRNFSKLSRRS